MNEIKPLESQHFIWLRGKIIAISEDEYWSRKSRIKLRIAKQRATYAAEQVKREQELVESWNRYLKS